tara:strand:+ start:219 stop:1418 length:1200 start_codon:yes stop_codon:yes gene_type:complete
MGVKMPLTVKKISSAQPTNKRYRLFDGGGLYLEVSPAGTKTWALKYRVAGKEKKYTIGNYPAVGLADARLQREQLKAGITAGKDPAANKKLEKLSTAANLFGIIANEWFDVKIKPQSEAHAKRTGSILKNHLMPHLANRPMVNVTPPELLGVLRLIEGQGSINTAHRAKQIAGQIYRYAIASGRAERDPSADLAGAMVAHKTKHFAAVTEPADVAKLMIAIDGYQGQGPVVTAALRISPLLFQRPGEIRHMEWSEIDFDNALWSIPAEKMKQNNDHLVPLSGQAIAILLHIQLYTYGSRYVFPSARSNDRPVSENALRVALLTMGYTGKHMTAHGFRAMGRTLLDEVLGYRQDWIEQQLSHRVKDPNGRAYNRTKNLNGRREMMQAWADYLDELKGTLL